MKRIRLSKIKKKQKLPAHLKNEWWTQQKERISIHNLQQMLFMNNKWSTGIRTYILTKIARYFRHTLGILKKLKPKQSKKEKVSQSQSIDLHLQFNQDTLAGSDILEYTDSESVLTQHEPEQNDHQSQDYISINPA